MKHTFKRFTVGLALAMGAVWVGAGSASTGAILAVETDPSEAARPGGPSAAAADCEALPTTDFTTIQDAPAQVTEALVVDAGWRCARPLPCGGLCLAQCRDRVTTAGELRLERQFSGGEPWWIWRLDGMDGPLVR